MIGAYSNRFMSKIHQITSFLFLALISVCPTVMAQDDLSQWLNDSTVSKAYPIIATFKSPQIINSQSNETVHRNDLNFVVTHRFGDIAGSHGGTRNFFGLDQSTDIRIAFTYGVSDRLSIGIGRTKGAPNGTSTHQKELFDLNVKYRLLQQTTDNRMPVSLTIFGNGVISAMERLPLETSDAAFHRFSDRLSYTAQLIIARKFSKALSLALLPAYVRRNYVPFGDMNNLYALGIGGRLKISARMAVIADHSLSLRTRESKNFFLQQKNFRFYNPLGLGLEMETGGHVFSVIFTNATAILENQFLAGTSTTWTKGQARWGFSISRAFSVGTGGSQ